MVDLLIRNKSLPDLRQCVCELLSAVRTKIINNQEGPVTHTISSSLQARPARLETSTRTRIKSGRVANKKLNQAQLARQLHCTQLELLVSGIMIILSPKQLSYSIQLASSLQTMYLPRSTSYKLAISKWRLKILLLEDLPKEVFLISIFQFDECKVNLALKFLQP